MSSRNVRMINADGNMKPVVGGEVALAVADSAVSLPEFPQDAAMVFVSVNSASVQVRFDGTAPTSSTGHTLAAGFTGTWTATMARAAKFIRTGGSSGYVFATPVVN